ncbi:MAG: hypothetical protein A2846_00670 [Candidatus Doudnabacteria bacterium RIFCSPHIGHO2_01_FULL_49_9]|uniref:LysM domain-containing protein n=1 Tax=Candidatus Doudnabacteria bacterium RIFCSPHIGHO2_01_FULL_49_9 TaxID=1817827 RepID=A0A1F5NZK4_9BACT|nr:MAG: hypothetical protein A2846_00670 [Candidatus Doudnabacteria bacterium RIFCSPHIGHO2_01_FULL_49_9]
MILSSRNKIRLSKTLHAQTTPYPRMHLWVKRAALALILAVTAGAYYAAQPGAAPETESSAALPKEILGDQEQARTMETYTVKKGDTLFNISQNFDLSWQTLAEINNLQEPYLLKIGQSLRIPIPQD